MHLSGVKILPAAVALLIWSGCSSSSDNSGVTTPVSNEQSTISTAEAILLITALEQSPFSADATAQRTVLTAWTVASPDIGPLAVDDRYIVHLQEGDYPYGSELFLQYMFGLARAQATMESPRHADVIESGLRSLLAAYKSMVLADDTLRDRFLDDLDELRRKGKLREYIIGVDRSR